MAKTEEKKRRTEKKAKMEHRRTETIRCQWIILNCLVFTSDFLTRRLTIYLYLRLIIPHDAGDASVVGSESQIDG